MFTFHWIELLVIVVSGLLLLLGLAILMLRRRNEMLQKFLTPDQLNIEEEFFRVRHPAQEQEEMNSEEKGIVGESEAQTTEAESEETVHWGTPQETGTE